MHGVASHGMRDSVLEGHAEELVAVPPLEGLRKHAADPLDCATFPGSGATVTEAQERLVPNFAGGATAKGDRYAFTGPEQLIILMAGGGGLYSMVMPSWCAGAHKNSPSSIVIESEFFCEVPGLAALTEN